jgi:glycine cleavage system H protein
MTKYSIHNAFVRVEKNFAYVGASELLADELDDIEYISFPEVGEIYGEDDLFTIDTVSDSHHFISPISGEIVEVNEELENDPKILTHDSEFSGWVCKIKLSDKSELDDLMTFEKYRDFYDGKEEYYD